MQFITTLLRPNELMSWRTPTRVGLALAALFGIDAPAIGQAPLLTPYIDDPARLAATMEYPDTPSWLFFRTRSYCYASLENDHGRLLVGYNRTSDEVHLGFWSDTSRAYANGTRLTAEIVMWDYRRDGSLKPIRYWNPLPMTVLVNASRRPVFNVKLAGRQALFSLRKHAGTSFMGSEGEMLQAFELSYSAVALRRLETCDPR